MSAAAVGEELSAGMEARIRTELASDERLVWPGRAQRSPAPENWPVFALCLIAVIFLGGALFGSRSPGLFVFASLLAAAVVVFLAGQRRAWPRAVAFYALTDRRAIVWLPVATPGSYQVRSFRPAEMNTLFRTEHADDSGDLIFFERPRPPSPWPGLFADGGVQQLGFRYIRQVRRVEELLRSTLIEPRPNGAPPSPPHAGSHSEHIQAERPPLSPRWPSDDPTTSG